MYIYIYRYISCEGKTIKSTTFSGTQSFKLLVQQSPAESEF